MTFLTVFIFLEAEISALNEDPLRLYLFEGIPYIKELKMIYYQRFCLIVLSKTKLAFSLKGLILRLKTKTRLMG